MELSSVLCDQLFASFSSVASNSQIAQHDLKSYDIQFARDLASLLLRHSMGIKHDATSVMLTAGLKPDDWTTLSKECTMTFTTNEDIKQFAILLRKTFELYTYDLNLERGQFHQQYSTLLPHSHFLLGLQTAFQLTKSSRLIVCTIHSS